MNRDEFVVRSRAPSIARGILIALITIALGAGMTWVWITQSTYAAVGDAYPAELMPVSMILDGDIEFDEYAPNPEQLPYWYKHVKGRTISFYPIVPGLMNWPVFYVAYLQSVDIKSNVQGLTHWTCAIVSACSVSLMFLALIGLTRHVGLSIFMVLIYMFATEVFSVTGRALWQHGPSLFFLTGALAAMFADRKWLYAIAGFMLGMAVWNRPTNIAFAIPLATYVAIFRPRWFWVLAAGGFFPAAGLAWYSLHYWGTLRSLGQGHFSAATHGPHQTSLGGEFLPGFAGVMFSPARGLFIHSPIFLLAMPAMLWCFVDLAKRFKRRNADGGGQIAEGGSGNSQPPIEISPSLRHTPLLVFLAAATILNIVIFSKWTIWWGGHSFGYRMLIEIIPALTVFLAVAWHRWFSRRWYGIVLFLLLLLPSLFIHYLGFRYYPSDWNVNPINTDFAKERMWDWQDTELTRLYKRFESDWFPEETKPPG